MATIKASCPDCGEVELTSADVRLIVFERAPLSFYAFTCPSCGDEVRKRADDQVIALLMSGGVRPQVITVPAEASEPHAGPPLTEDDLIAFGRRLHLTLFPSAEPSCTT